ncbi:MAG: NUDIX hydrolase [Acidobacteriota bacterium]|nr:NUDIX hydrolase [Acidobacteriota bacterium]
MNTPTAKASGKATPVKKPTARTPSETTPANKKKPAKKSRLISSKLAYKGKVFSVFQDEVEEPGGHKNVREVIRHSGSVVILAVDETNNPADPEIIFERQYRHAAGQILVELPAGRLDPGESPLAGAKREMIEETGYRAKKWTLLAKYFASPGFLGEWMQIYLAEDIRAGEATPEEDENIEVFRMPLSEAMGLVAENKIHDGKTLIGLMLYAHKRQRANLQSGNTR